jgi:hypothetical protein
VWTWFSDILASFASLRLASRLDMASEEVEMRGCFLIVFSITALLLPKQAAGQVFYQPTPPPQVTAASEAWQLNGEPILSDGSYYYPSGPTVFFDGNVMSRTGVYRGIPLYQDRTREPHSIIYVPIGGTVMRPYERRREGELAGTTGSRTPSWPPQIAAPTSMPRAIPTQPTLEGARGARPPVFPQTQLSLEPPGRIGADAAAVAQTSGTTGGAAPSHVAIMTIGPEPPAGAAQGVWIQYAGERWYHVGPAVAFDPERFVPTGEYRGFPVYRAKNGGEEIYVPVVRDGGLTPYAKR